MTEEEQQQQQQEILVSNIGLQPPPGNAPVTAPRVAEDRKRKQYFQPAFHTFLSASCPWLTSLSVGPILPFTMFSDIYIGSVIRFILLNVFTLSSRHVIVVNSPTY